MDTIASALAILGLGALSVAASIEEDNRSAQEERSEDRPKETRKVERSHYPLSGSQEYELELAESKRLDNVCSSSINQINARWNREIRDSSWESERRKIDDRYFKMVNELIKNCKSNQSNQ